MQLHYCRLVIMVLVVGLGTSDRGVNAVVDCVVSLFFFCFVAFVVATSRIIVIKRLQRPNPPDIAKAPDQGLSNTPHTLKLPQHFPEH